VVHQFQNNGYNIVLDVNSGAVHLVDEVMYDTIRLYQDYTKAEIVHHLASQYGQAEILEALEEIGQLMANEQLFTEDKYEIYSKELKSEQPVVKAMCLHIAHDCNLACQYCFAEEGEYHGKRELMSFETGKAALNYLIQNSGSRRNLEVDFFGGEPLMNFQVVKDLVQYGREQEKRYDKNFRFTLTTNGVLLNDEVIAFANQEMANVVLSIDGRKKIHDQMRPFRSGAGSYDRIVPQFVKFAASRKQSNYFVRGTYTRHNMDFSEDVLHLADLGFQQISVEPVVGAQGQDYTFTENDLPRLYQEYDKLAKSMIEREAAGVGFQFFHFMIDLDGGPCVAKRLKGCGSGTEYLAVTPSGELYPCHQFVGMDEFLMGNVRDGIKDESIPRKFQGCNVYSKEKCRTCFAKFYCSGGCAANSYQSHGEINNVYDIGCELQKKRVECALMLKAAQAERM
jgi:uncharacterized protein